MFLFRKIFLITSFFLSALLIVSAQEIKKGDAYNYARKVVDTLASPSMHGRGYVNDGDKLAANYIKSQFEKFGLKSFQKGYYQLLSFAVNTFPEVTKFYWSGIGDLAIGKDFIIAPASGSAKLATSCAVVWLDSAMYHNPDAFHKFAAGNNTKNYIAIDFEDRPEEELMRLFEGKAVGLIFIKHKKLTADFQQYAMKIPAVELLIHDNITEQKLHANSNAILVFKNLLLPKHATQNVIGYIQGTEHPDSFIVFTAHYDHIGEMGKALFPGANDNASGTAMLLNVARYYSMPEHKPKCSIVFMSFCGEEVGLLGSQYYVEHPLFPLKQIRFLLNMDIMGTGEDGVTIVNGSIYKKEFDALKKINDDDHFIKDVKIRGKAANSDHYSFSEKGVRACFVYTMGGIKAYHDVYDKAETLPLNEFQNLFGLIVKFEGYLDNE